MWYNVYKMKLRITLFVLISMITSSVFAQEKTVSNPQPLKLLLGFAAEFGGDDIARVYFTNGEDQSVRAGQGVTLFAGGQLRLLKSETLFLRSSLGIKYVTTAAENANIRLTRIPFNNTINFFPSPQFRLAAGLSTHNAIKFNGDGFLPNLKLKSNIAPVLEFAYQGFGISYTIMKYDDNFNNSYSANSFGFTYTGVLFGKK